MLKKCFKMCRYSKRIVDWIAIRLEKIWFPHTNFCNSREYKFTLVTSLKRYNGSGFFYLLFLHQSTFIDQKLCLEDTLKRVVFDFLWILRSRKNCSNDRQKRWRHFWNKHGLNRCNGSFVIVFRTRWFMQVLLSGLAFVLYFILFYNIIHAWFL